MKRALSRKNLWENSPPAVRATVGRLLGLVPQSTLLGRRFRRTRRFLAGAQSWSAEQSRDYQLHELARVCRVAYQKAPFYRRWFDAVGFDPRELQSFDEFSQLPTIDKEQVRQHVEEMCTVSPRSPHVDFVSTGGTGGRPLHFYMGAGRSPVEYAYLAASWQRAGYELGMPMVVLRGRTLAMSRHGFHYEYDPVLRHHHYSVFHMTDEDMRRYIDHLGTIGPCYLHAYPSAAAALARFVRRSGIRPPENIVGLIAESEIVYPQQRRLVEEVFGCRYFSCYGHTEKLVLAAECEHSADYHVWPTYGFFELLDENGRPVTGPGRSGEIVATGFVDTVVPFIRYRTGDWATYVGDRCDACGRQHVVIRDVRGHRTQEVLIAADGSEIAWVALNMHDDTFVRVRQFQFYQDVPGQAVLRVVPGDGFGTPDMRRIAANLAHKLDGRLVFTIRVVDGIPVSPRGKAIYVDQRTRLVGMNVAGS